MRAQNKRKAITFGLVIFAIVLLGPAATFSQDQHRPTTFTNTAKNFEFTIDSAFLIDRENHKVTIFGYSGPLSISVQTDKTQDPKGYVKRLYYPKEKSTKSEKAETGDFLVRKFEYETAGQFSTSIFIASSDDYFVISASASRKSDPELVRFFQSIRLNGKPLVPSMRVSENDPNAFIITKQEVSQVVLDALIKPKNTTTKAQFALVKEDPVVYDPSFSRGLIILRKPRPTYTDSARQNNKQGTIRAKVEFLKDGQIGGITVDPTLDRGLAENVAKVVKLIKFIPAEINGKPVDIMQVVEYGFAIY